MLTFVAFWMLADHMLLAYQPIIAPYTCAARALLCHNIKVIHVRMTCSLYMCCKHTFIIRGHNAIHINILFTMGYMEHIHAYAYMASADRKMLCGLQSSARSVLRQHLT